MENVIFVENACFYVKDGKAAVSIEDVPVLADSAVYDDKNTLLLAGVDGKTYAVQNIVPDVRMVLKDSDDIMVILEKDNDIAGAYELPLKHNETLGFEDNFANGAKDFYKFVEDLTNL